MPERTQIFDKVLIGLVCTVGAAAAAARTTTTTNQEALTSLRQWSSAMSTLTSYNGPSYEKILELRKEHVTPSAVPFYRKPLLIHRGEMQYLYDHKGGKYLDMFGGIVTVSVGHCHP